MLLSTLLSNPNYPKKSIIEKLVMHRVNISKEELFTKNTLKVSEEDVLRIQDGYRQITTDHRPIEHVIGYCEFAGHRFAVTGDTLIPRPETEYMIEAVREWLEKRKSPPTPLFGKEEENMTIDSALLQKTVKDDSQLPLTTNTSEQQSQSSTSDSPLSQRGARGDSSVTLLDIGTGCGVLGLSTLLHAGKYIGTSIFTDLSKEALDVAKENATKLLGDQKFEVGNRTKENIQFLECSLLDHEVIRESIRKSPPIPLFGKEEESMTIDSALLQKTVKGGSQLPLTTNTSEQQSQSSTSDSLLSQRGARGDLLIVANLPYIPEGLFTDNTDPSVHKREPKMAFVGGDDGMDLYRIMLEQIVGLSEVKTTDEGTKYLSSGSSNPITLFLEMMTWQVEILRKEFGEWFEFEEVKTFHFNIRIVKAVVRGGKILQKKRFGYIIC